MQRRQASSEPVGLPACSPDQPPQHHWGPPRTPPHWTADPRPHPRPTESEPSEGECSNLCLNKPPADSDAHSHVRTPSFGNEPPRVRTYEQVYLRAGAKTRTWPSCSVLSPLHHMARICLTSDTERCPSTLREKNPKQHWLLRVLCPSRSVTKRLCGDVLTSTALGLGLALPLPQ